MELNRSLSAQTVIFIGGSSGLGKAAAMAFARRGGNAVIVGRAEAKLAAAAEEIAVCGGAVRSQALDFLRHEDVDAFFADFAEASVQHLVISASQAVHGPFAELAEDAARGMFDAKFWAPYRAARAALPKLADGASITFFSGVLSRRPGLNCSALGAVNAAVEGLTRGLALELGPRIRVNCCSPGMVDTEAYAKLPDDRRQAMYRATGASLPVRRVGRAEEVGEAVLSLMCNGYMTGVVLDVDGGHMVRQYAEA